MCGSAWTVGPPGRGHEYRGRTTRPARAGGSRNWPKCFAEYDWGLQLSLARLSPNPVYLLLLNSFHGVYPKMAEIYFSDKIHRMISRKYYAELLHSLLQNDLTVVERITKEMMKTSLDLWKEKTRSEKHEV